MVMAVLVDENMISYRNHAILEVFYSTGIRLSELHGLDYDRIDFYNGVIGVIGKGNKERILPIGSKAVEAVRNYLPLRSNCLSDNGCIGEKALFISNRGRRLGKRSIQASVTK